MLSLSVRGAARHLVPDAVRRQLRRRMARVLRAAGVGEAEVCISLTDDAELRELNRRFAGEDHATDVLSFSQRGVCPSPPGEGELLGDIVISLEAAVRQAAAAGHPLSEELLHLAVHGLCHLLGYDHATPDEERVMFGHEARLRAEARRGGPVRAVPPP
ncbi:MAG: rRNA maturation RNase YbeY [Myxococcales bacterium]|nr:rRNA maturation RNase YbeY [Myxococcota bacterium]MDW8280340.1 rRNA maturation RNase YbeY [Myxococcales bacterium]